MEHVGFKCVYGVEAYTWSTSDSSLSTAVRPTPGARRFQVRLQRRGLHLEHVGFRCVYSGEAYTWSTSVSGASTAARPTPGARRFQVCLRR